jgi:TRAP-type C4-dicarboxylate transport system permease small subunit
MKPSRYSVEGALSTVLLIALSLVIFLQIAGRMGIFAGQVWTEELIRWLWVWMACLGFSEAERHQQHLRMDMVPSLWRETLRRRVYRAIDAMTFVLSLYMVWLGYKGVIRTWHDESVTLGVSDAVLYAALPVGAALWALRLFLRLAGKRQPEPWSAS